MAAASIRRRLLYSLATSDRFEAAVRSVLALEEAAYRLAKRYVAGRRFEDAADLISRLDAESIAASVDFFGEQVSEREEAARATDAYVSLCEGLATLPSTTSVAIDLSHIGVDVSHDFCRSQLERIVEALPDGRRIDIGAEDSGRTDAILAVALDVAQAGAPIQMTLQANLRRSVEDWRALVEAGAAIRLVKGAYVESPEVAYPYGEETDIAFVRLAHLLHEAGARFALGHPRPRHRGSPGRGGASLDRDAPRCSL